MLDYLNKNNYVVIPNFLDKDLANNLSNQFKSFMDKNPQLLNYDSQVPGARGLYNHIPFVQILVERTKDVGLLIKEPVLPTYCYAREYRHLSSLDSHSDMPSCEVSLSVHLSGDEQWPLYFKSLDGSKIEVKLEVGDAVLYYGQAIEHGRDEYKGKQYVQLFLHYVKSEGIHFHEAFDGVRREQRAVLKFIDSYLSDSRLKHPRHKNISDFLHHEKTRLLVLWRYYT